MTEKKEKAVELFDLVVRNKMLPAKLEELVPLAFMGQAAVTFYREKVALMDKLGVTEEQRKVTLRDGQDAGKMLLAVEARIGELLPEPEEAQRRGGLRADGTLKKQKVLPPEMDGHQASAARAIARHPEAVAQVIAEAEKNQDIPTKTAVLTEIKRQKEQERRERAEKAEPTKLTMRADELAYINALDRVIQMLPNKPPKDWSSEMVLNEARARVAVIRKRLEVF